MDQDNFSIIYKKPNKLKKQIGGLRLDNEASLQEFMDTFPMVRTINNYFMDMNIKEDFTDFTTLINPTKNYKLKEKQKEIEKLKKMNKKNKIVVKPYKSEELKDIPAPKELLKRSK